MKIAAVISEYNPFHNGHKYQLDEIKKEYDAVMAIMSGSFVQRGDLALCDKWSRAGAAVKGGVDLVIELPVIYTLSSASDFAMGGVKTAEATGIADALIFGSECGDLTILSEYARILNEEPEEISEKIKAYLKEGNSYPAAREKAYSGLIDSNILSGENNILGIEYITALKKIGSAIKPGTVKRIGAGYNEIGYEGTINSASGIRAFIKEGKSADKFLPEGSRKILANAVYYDIEKLSGILRYAVLSNPSKLSDINGVSEGLENRIRAEIAKGGDFLEIAERIKSKRYTMSRIRRTLISVILGIETGEPNSEPEYIRALAMNKTGMEILKKMKKNAALPIVTKAADFTSPIFEREIRATDIAELSVNNGGFGRDYKMSPIIAERND